VDWDLTFVARDLGTIPGEALTSDKKSTHAKGPTIILGRGNGAFSSACIAQDASWPEPLSANSFPQANYPEREHGRHNQLAPFSSFRHAAGPLVETPTDE
jgi:hypothetical protein